MFRSLAAPSRGPCCASQRRVWVPAVGAMADGILQQLGSCKSLLSALQGRPGFSKASSAETLRLQTSLRVASLSTADLGKIAEGIVDVGFTPEDTATILDTLADVAGSAQAPAVKSTSPRSTTQNWVELDKYLTAEVMQKMKDENLVECFLDHLVKMGLRHPSEPTSLTISLIVLCATSGFEKTLNMEQDAKRVFNEHLKKMFKARVGRWPSPSSYVFELPSKPEVFKQQFPALFAAAFQGHQPMAPPISELEFVQLRTSCRMRKLRGSSSSSMLALPAAEMGLPAGLVQFGQALAGQVKMIADEVKKMKQAGDEDSLLTMLQPRPSKKRQAPQPQEAGLPSQAPQPSGEASSLALVPPPPVPTPASPPQPLVLEPKDAGGNIDDIANEIRQALSAGKAKAKAKAKGKAKAQGKAKAAKGKASATSMGSGKLTSKPPAMPKFEKRSPIYWGSCTVYTDAKKRQWRAIEAAAPRRDVKFPWSKDGWNRLLEWCRSHGHDL